MKKLFLLFLFWLLCVPGAWATNYFCDTVGGNNSNNGTTFAQRKLTIAAAEALCSPGDTVRVMASNPAVSLGHNATFTNKSATITEASASTTLISDCEAAWTGALNVTATASTGTMKENAKSASLVIAGAFTTGQIAYFPTGTLDLSAYRQISFWERNTVAIPASTLRVDLCSDTIGAVPVYSFTIANALNATNSWTCLDLDNGSPMTLAIAIQSISITALLDPGAVTVLCDDFCACGSPTAGLTLHSLIGKNDGVWFPIRSIKGTTVILDKDPDSISSATPRGYSGTTATVTAYILPVIPLNVTSASNPYDWQTLSGGVSGTSGNQITISGGWNTTDMTTQTGYTVWSGGWSNTGVSNGLSLASLNYITLDHLGFSKFGTPFRLETGTNVRLTNCYIIGCTSALGAAGTSVWDTVYLISTNTSRTALTVSYNNCYFLSNASTGITTGNAITPAAPCKLSSCTANNNAAAGFTNVGPGAVHFSLTAKDNETAGIVTIGSGNAGFQIVGATVQNNTTSGISNTGLGKIANLTSSGNTTSGVDNQTGTLYLYNAAVTDTTPFNTITGSGKTFSERAGGVAGISSIYSALGTIATDTTHAKVGTCWAMPVTSASATQAYPQFLSIGKFACKANQARTIKYWAARTNANLSGQLRITGGIYPGVGSAGTDVTTSLTPTADATVVPGDYSQYGITFTPTQNTVVEVFADWWPADGVTTYTGYIDGPIDQGN